MDIPEKLEHWVRKTQDEDKKNKTKQNKIKTTQQGTLKRGATAECWTS